MQLYQVAYCCKLHLSSNRYVCNSCLLIGQPVPLVFSSTRFYFILQRIRCLNLSPLHFVNFLLLNLTLKTHTVFYMVMVKLSIYKSIQVWFRGRFHNISLNFIFLTDFSAAKYEVLMSLSSVVCYTADDNCQFFVAQLHYLNMLYLF